MLVTLPVAIGYNYWVAPGVPAARVATLCAKRSRRPRATRSC